MSPFVVVFAAVCACASAQLYRSTPYAAGYDHYDQYDNAPASYSFSYDVQEPLTGDFKSQAETRDGDVVQGHYSLLESDGTRRIVEYTADAVNGFNAVVHKEGEPSVGHGYAAGAVAPAAPVAAKAYQPAVAKYPVVAPVAAPAARYYQPSYARAFAPAPAYARAFAPAPAYARSFAPAPAYARSFAPAPAYARAFAAPAFARNFAHPAAYTTPYSAYHY